MECQKTNVTRNCRALIQWRERNQMRYQCVILFEDKITKYFTIGTKMQLRSSSFSVTWAWKFRCRRHIRPSIKVRRTRRWRWNPRTRLLSRNGWLPWIRWVGGRIWISCVHLIHRRRRIECISLARCVRFLAWHTGILSAHTETIDSIGNVQNEGHKPEKLGENKSVARERGYWSDIYCCRPVNSIQFANYCDNDAADEKE